MKVGRVLPLVAGLLLGLSQLTFAADSKVTFVVNDEPGYWFDLGKPEELNPNKPYIGTRSLAIVPVGTHVEFTQSKGPKKVESYHTITNLVWPTDANGPVGPMGLTDSANMNDFTVENGKAVTLTKTGLYVWVCKLHPYMLGAVIVDDPNTKSTEVSDPENLLNGASLDLGDATNGELTLLGTAGGTITFKDTYDVAARLLRAFFIVTTPSNWKDYTKVGQVYQPAYPPVPVHANSAGLSVNLNGYLLSKGYDGKEIEKQQKPKQKGIGEVWVDTAYELSAGKEEWFPGTMTVVSATGWNVKRKIALPEQKMNNGHNFWTSNNQKEIYQTEWHGNSLYVINRLNGKLIQELDLVNGNEVKTFGPERCHDPAHVMTRLRPSPLVEQVHVGCNGGNTVLELNRDPATRQLSINRFIPMSTSGPQTQPHAHWMGFDGNSMITPNSNTGDSTLFDFPGNAIVNGAPTPTGALPIATGMMPDSSRNYVSNYLGDTISVMCGQYPPVSGPGAGCAKGTNLNTDINLLQGYDPVGGGNNGSIPGGVAKGPYGGFSVQTPVSPDGKFVIQGNTLSGTITILDTATDKLVWSMPCDPGCHGVNFGAKKGGGYYAYVTSKFANRLIVLDYDPDNNGILNDNGLPPVVAGAVVLANDNVPKDDKIIGNRGMGGQGIMAVPNVYNGWVQELPIGYRAQLTREQRNPIGPVGGGNPHR